MFFIIIRLNSPIKNGLVLGSLLIQLAMLGSQRKKKWYPKDIWENSGYILSQCNKLEINIGKKKLKTYLSINFKLLNSIFELKKGNIINRK